MSRKRISAGNWKMNVLPSEVKSFVESLKQTITPKENTEVMIFVPFVDLVPALETVKGSSIKVGAQNMYFEEKGAFTGEVSPTMLKDIGIDNVLIGHSERRQYFGETDETVNKKLHSAHNHGLKPIICVGESLEQREQGIMNDIVESQITKGFKDLTDEQAKQTIIAYEPIWAIGTGKTATKEDANNACKFIRSIIEKLYNKEIAENIIILYGGSVKANNAKELFEMSDIDGGLVGGASLKVEEFEQISAV